MNLDVSISPKTGVVLGIILLNELSVFFSGTSTTIITQIFVHLMVCLMSIGFIYLYLFSLLGDHFKSLIFKFIDLFST
jgi:hypothetical protein